METIKTKQRTAFNFEDANGLHSITLSRSVAIEPEPPVNDLIALAIKNEVTNKESVVFFSQEEAQNLSNAIGFLLIDNNE